MSAARKKGGKGKKKNKNKKNSPPSLEDRAAARSKENSRKNDRKLVLTAQLTAKEFLDLDDMANIPLQNGAQGSLHARDNAIRQILTAFIIEQSVKMGKTIKDYQGKRRGTGLFLQGAHQGYPHVCREVLVPRDVGEDTHPAGACPVNTDWSMSVDVLMKMTPNEILDMIALTSTEGVHYAVVHNYMRLGIGEHAQLVNTEAGPQWVRNVPGHHDGAPDLFQDWMLSNVITDGRRSAVVREIGPMFPSSSHQVVIIQAVPQATVPPPIKLTGDLSRFIGNTPQVGRYLVTGRPEVDMVYVLEDYVVIQDSSEPCILPTNVCKVIAQTIAGRSVNEPVVTTLKNKLRTFTGFHDDATVDRVLTVLLGEQTLRNWHRVDWLQWIKAKVLGMNIDDQADRATLTAAFIKQVNALSWDHIWRVVKLVATVGPWAALLLYYLLKKMKQGIKTAGVKAISVMRAVGTALRPFLGMGSVLGHARSLIPTILWSYAEEVIKETIWRVLASNYYAYIISAKFWRTPMIGVNIPETRALEDTPANRFGFYVGSATSLAVLLAPTRRWSLLGHGIFATFELALYLKRGHGLKSRVAPFLMHLATAVVGPKYGFLLHAGYNTLSYIVNARQQSPGPPPPAPQAGYIWEGQLRPLAKGARIKVTLDGLPIQPEQLLELARPELDQRPVVFPNGIVVGDFKPQMQASNPWNFYVGLRNRAMFERDYKPVPDLYWPEAFQLMFSILEGLEVKWENFEQWVSRYNGNQKAKLRQALGRLQLDEPVKVATAGFLKAELNHSRPELLEYKDPRIIAPPKDEKVKIIEGHILHPLAKAINKRLDGKKFYKIGDIHYRIMIYSGIDEDDPTAAQTTRFERFVESCMDNSIVGRRVDIAVCGDDNKMCLQDGEWRVFIADDKKRWDAHYGEEPLTQEAFMFTKLASDAGYQGLECPDGEILDLFDTFSKLMFGYADNVKVDCMAYMKHYKTRIQATFDPQRQSGQQNTGEGNGVANAAAGMVVAQALFATVHWDARDLDGLRVVTHNLWAKFGMNSVVNVSEDPTDLDFCSARLVPVGGRYYMVPKLGRAVFRMGWSVQNPRTPEELRAYVHAYNRYINVPYFGPILRKMSEILGPGPEKWYKALYFASTSGLGAPVPAPDHETWEWLERIYGLSEDDAKQFESLVNNVEQLPALIPAGSSASRLLVDLDIDPDQQSDWSLGPASVLPIICQMVNKNKGKKRAKQSKANNKGRTNQRMGPRVPVQQEMAGRRHVQRPMTKVNGESQVAVKHHFSEIMNKKSGMHSPASKAVCAVMTSPFKADAPPVINTKAYLYSEDSAGDEAPVIAPVYPRPGMVYQGRQNVVVTVGTGKFGFLALCNGWGGWSNVYDMGYTTGAFTGTTFPASIGGTGVTTLSSCPKSQPAPSGIANSGQRIAWLLGTRIRYVVNNNDASARAGSVWAYSSTGPISGYPFTQLDDYPWARKFSALNLAEGNEVCVIAPRGLVGNGMIEGTYPSTLYMARSTGWSGLVFEGVANQTYTVEIEYAVFCAGQSIPPAVTPMVSQAAIDCGAACLAELHAREPGVYGHDLGARVHEVHEAAEQHSVASLPSAVTSAVWPVVKQLASSGGAALMRWVSSLAGL
jgi:hypothetical protein